MAIYFTSIVNIQLINYCCNKTRMKHSNSHQNVMSSIDYPCNNLMQNKKLILLIQNIATQLLRICCKVRVLLRYSTTLKILTKIAHNTLLLRVCCVAASQKLINKTQSISRNITYPTEKP